ncbi:MAG: cytochrome b6-f complex iron-sulfur subunit [Synechococcaceae cyanobacterium SM2_3_1]|nr:cytochrome b6-f complex iron-sulfur subunit [Synechococcaceae cyanobacterium SM2_3_1]
MTEAVSKFEAPPMSRRVAMNTLLGGSIGVVVLGALYPVVRYFIPPSSGAGSKGVVAKDKVGKPLSASAVVASHPGTDRVLAQGLKGDPTYIVINDGSIANYGLNAICTHLGCVVPWNAGEGIFKCPCHGSQYAPNGKVTRGPAPRSLELAEVTVTDDEVRFSPWEEPDFREV